MRPRCIVLRVCQTLTLRLPLSMSGINRFLSRRDKHHRWSQNKDSNPQEVQQEKVMLPKMPSSIPIHSSSSVSSSRTVSGISTPLPYSLASTSSSSTSSSSSPFFLSLAFSKPKTKRSPRLQATDILVQSSTANTADHCVLQPRATSGHLHGLFSDFEETAPEKDAEQKVRGTMGFLNSGERDLDVA